MEKLEDNANPVTGNMKHYPMRDFIITPAEMVTILEEKKASERKKIESSCCVWARRSKRFMKRPFGSDRMVVFSYVRIMK